MLRSVILSRKPLSKRRPTNKMINIGAFYPKGDYVFFPESENVYFSFIWCYMCICFHFNFDTSFICCCLSQQSAQCPESVLPCESWYNTARRCNQNTKLLGSNIWSYICIFKSDLIFLMCRMSHKYNHTNQLLKSI